jgi:Ca-activated chloride channel homolog
MRTVTITLTLAAVIFSLLCAAQETGTHKGVLAPGGSVNFRIEPLNNYWHTGSNSDELFVYVHLQGEKKTSEGPVRLPLNLSVVIDKSGSMSGAKIDYVRKAVDYLVSNLSEEDRISIVLYDTEVKVLCEPQTVGSSKSALRAKVSTITADGSTNLEGGMRKGFELVKSVRSLIGKDKEMINRVLLLSDGQANVGVTDPTELSKISNEYFNEHRISISTFGVGADYNEDLMSKVAGQGGGQYYFISNPEQLPELFRNELQGLSSVIAKNVMLMIKYPENLVRLDHVYSYTYKVSDGMLVMNFNDMFSEEQKSITIRFKVNNKVKDKIAFSGSLSYRAENGSPQDIAHDLTCSVEHVPDKEAYQKGFNKVASEGYVLQVATEKFEAAVQAANNRQFDPSRKLIKEAKEALDTHFRLFGEHPFLKGLYKEMKEYEDVISDLEKMKDSNEFNISIKKHKSSNYYRKYRSKF